MHACTGTPPQLDHNSRTCGGPQPTKLHVSAAHNKMPTRQVLRRTADESHTRDRTCAHMVDPLSPSGMLRESYVRQRPATLARSWRAASIAQERKPENEALLLPDLGVSSRKAR